MANYTKLAQTAKRLIEKNGRTVTLRSVSPTPADPTKPWRARSDADVEVSVIAVILDNKLTDEDEVLRGTRKAYVAQESAPVVDLSDYGLLIESSGEQWKVDSVEILTPGDVVIYYKLMLKQ